MASPPALTQLSFASGLDESAEPEILDPMSGFAVLQNGRQDRRGGYAKRLGYDALPLTRLDGSSRSGGNRLFAHRDTVVSCDGTHFDVYSPTTGRSSVKSRAPEATWRNLATPSLGSSSSFAQDVAAVNGYVVVAYLSAVRTGTTTSNYYAYAYVIDASNGAIVRGPDLLGQASVTNGAAGGVQLVNYGTYALSVFAVDSTSSIYTCNINLSSASTVNTGWSSPSAIAAGTFQTGTSAAWCAANVVSNDRAVLAFTNNLGGTDRITVRTFSISGQVETVNINSSSVAPLQNCLAVSESGDTIWVAWKDQTNNLVKAIGLDPTNIDGTPLATTATVFTLSTSTVSVHVAPRTSAQTASVYVCTTGETGTFLSTYARGIKSTAGATATDGARHTLGGTLVRSTPFLRSGRTYAMISSHNQGDMTLCDVTLDTAASTPKIYARPVAAPVARGLPIAVGFRGRFAATTSETYAGAINIIRSSSTFAAQFVEYNFADTGRWDTVQVNGTTYVGGGVTGVFDGERWFEMNFLAVPAKATLSTSAATGVSLTNGRVYVVVYEEIDAQGNVHISGVSTPSAKGSATTNQATIVSVPPLTVTSRGSLIDRGAASLRAVAYATADDANGSPPYYRLSDAVVDPSLDKLDIVDDVADAILKTSSLLYGTGNLPGTNGSVQDHRAPPGLKRIASYNGMLVGAAGSTLWYSSQPIAGEGAWSSPLFTAEVEADVTALAAMDGALYPFTMGGIYAVSGDPPSDNAASGGLGTPRKLAVDVGSTDGRVCVTELGVFFRSERGVELLSRGGGVTWIGEKVLRTLGTYPVVTSMVRDDRNGLLRISLGTSWSSGRVSGAGRDLVYDLSLKAWVAVDDKTGASSHEASQDAAMVTVGGVRRYAWIGTDGTVRYEKLATDATKCLDGSTWVTKVAETADFKLAGIQGRQFFNALLALMRKASDHNMSIAVAYSHEQTFRTATVYTRSMIDALLSGGWPITQLKHLAHNDSECQGVRFRLEDATPTGGTVGTGEGGTWLALTLDVVPRQGIFDVPEGGA